MSKQRFAILFVAVMGLFSAGCASAQIYVIDHNSNFGVGELFDLSQEIQSAPEASTWELLLGAFALSVFLEKRVRSDPQSSPTNS